MTKHARTWGLLGLAFATSTAAATPPAESPTPPAAADSKVAIDPATGKLRPLTPEERQHLQASDRALRSARRAEPAAAGKRGFVAPLTEAESGANRRSLPGGGTAQQVPESMMSELVVSRDADGTLRIRHAGADGHAEPQVAQEAAHE